MIVIKYKDGTVAVAADWERLEQKLVQAQYRYESCMDLKARRTLLVDHCRQYTGKEPSLTGRLLITDSQGFCTALASAGLFEIVSVFEPQPSGSAGG